MKELLEKRARIFEQARALVLKAETEARAFTPEEQASYDAHMVDVRALGETITRSRASADMEAELSRSIGPRGGDEPGLANRGRNPGSDAADSALDAFLRNGRDAMTTEQRGIFDPVRGFKDAVQLRSASPLSVVTGAAGADTVPTGFVYNLETALKWFGGMRQSRATVVRSATGAPLPWPTMNDTGNVGELVAENAAVTQAATEMSFGLVTLGAYKYSSKLVLVPIELIQDSAFDVQGFVARALGERLGRIQNTHFTVGTGSGQPTGIVTAATSALTTASATDVAIDELTVTLPHAVDPAYRVGAEYMFNDSSAAAFEKMKDNNGRPLLNSTFLGINEAFRSAEPLQPSKFTINGYPTIINNDMAGIAANAKPVLFGDFSKFAIRDVMDLMLVRFAETYMASGQIGFLAFMRADSNLIDAGMHPVQYITCHS